MSFPRLTLLALPVALCLPLMVGACGVPLALTAVSYGADGVSAVETGKTGTDHLASMVSNQDCALWRVTQGAAICHEQDPSNPNPYKVDYSEPFRQVGEGGSVEYSAPPRAVAGAPAQSWDAAVYKTTTAEAAPNTAPTESVKTAAEPAVVPATVPVPRQKAPAKAKKTGTVTAKAKKPSPDQVASSR